MRLDNSTFKLKRALRVRALRQLGVDPIIIETHGGYGALFAECYVGIERGIVLDNDIDKASFLAMQRPTWRVYQGRSEAALACGLGGDLAITLLDCDPWGDPWPTIQAFFSGNREYAPRMELVVTDGMRRRLKFHAWDVHSMRDKLEQYGDSGINEFYLDVCREKVGDHAAAAGYEITGWYGYYCGHCKEIAHYLAELEK